LVDVESRRFESAALGAPPKRCHRSRESDGALEAVVIFKALEFNGSANSLRPASASLYEIAPPSQTVDGLTGFDDHLTTILAEKRGNSWKLLEIRDADKTRWL
jgi:hypothetical protein